MPNRYGYIAVANNLIPEVAKSRILHNAQPDRKEEDVFPTYYRINTFGALRQLFPGDRFNHASFYWDPSPAYGFGSRFAYSFFSLLHRLTPEQLKTILMVFIQKRASRSVCIGGNRVRGEAPFTSYSRRKTLLEMPRDLQLE